MKKITIILTLFIAFIFAFKPASTYAWDDCVFDKVNDKFPGECARYIDTDNDNICDHSQPAPENRDLLAALGQGSIQEEKNAIADKKIKNDYHFGLISIILLFSYIISFLLTKFKKISIVLHRKLWNIFLTLSFMPTAILGILLVLKISYGINIDLPFKMVFWHVETGIIFTLVAIFHILWHLPYYKNLIFP